MYRLLEQMMATLTIAHLDDASSTKLRIRASRSGRSVEEEAKNLLETALEAQSLPSVNLAEAIHARFAPYGGFDIELPPREPMREPPSFD